MESETNWTKKSSLGKLRLPATTKLQKIVVLAGQRGHTLSSLNDGTGTILFHVTGTSLKTSKLFITVSFPEDVERLNQLMLGTFDNSQLGFLFVFEGSATIVESTVQLQCDSSFSI